MMEGKILLTPKSWSFRKFPSCETPPQKYSISHLSFQEYRDRLKQKNMATKSWDILVKPGQYVTVGWQPEISQSQPPFGWCWNPKKIMGYLSCNWWVYRISEPSRVLWLKFLNGHQIHQPSMWLSPDPANKAKVVATLVCVKKVVGLLLQSVCVFWGLSKTHLLPSIS